MLDWLIDPFSGGIMQRALAELVLLSLVCGPLGVWVVLHRQSYAAESIAHGMLPGLVLAVLIGAPLLLGAAVGVAVAAVAIALAARDPRLGADVGVAVAIGGLTGVGALLALAAQTPARLGEVLFGDPLGIAPGMLLATGVLVCVVAATLATAHRSLAVSGFDRAAARSLGAAPERSGLLLLALIGFTAVAAVQALGTLLALALLVAPAAAASLVTHRLGRVMAASVAIAVGSTVVGLLVSFHLEVAAGASVALVAVGAWAAASLLARWI